METYRSKWRLRFQASLNPGGYGDIIRKVETDGLFANWSRVWDPGDLAETYLSLTVDVLCGDPSHPHARTFLQYAKQAADRAVEETARWLPTGDWGNPEGTPGTTRGTLLRAKAFADALMADALPNPAYLIEAAHLVLDEGHQAKGSPFWTEVEQSICLSAVQLLLIAGELDAAKELFKWRKSFERTRHYYEWLRDLTRAIPESGQVASHEVLSHFDSFFDVVRDPAWDCPKGPDAGYNIIEDHNILRVQLALIKQRLLLLSSR